MQAWEEAGGSVQWCRERGADVRGLRFARDVRRQLEGIVKEDGSGLLPERRPSHLQDLPPPSKKRRFSSREGPACGPSVAHLEQLLGLIAKAHVLTFFALNSGRTHGSGSEWPVSGKKLRERGICFEGYVSACWGGLSSSACSGTLAPRLFPAECRA